ncbi:hypothetical protein ACIOHE_35025 [Streptomyces sp. NPDC087851]|uniref:hypothetical protein n=1 Tax=Streptomyces sp. NPDC087851 TaxID=3365810 RepID=UPI00381ADF1B
MTETGSPLRAVRAAAFAAVCVTLAAVGHALTSGASGASGESGASGHEIPLTALLAAFAVTACAAWLAGGRRRGALSIGAGLLTVQGLLHLFFAGALSYGLGLATSRHAPHAGTGAGTGTPTGTGTGTGGGSASGMGVSADVGMDMGAATDPGSGPAPALGELLGASPAMLAAHVVAAAVCALWLAQGEAALFRLVHAVGALAFTPLRLLLTSAALPAAPRLIRPRPGASRAHRFRGVVLAHTVSRRGPPARRAPRATAPGAAATAV